ncbi:MAG: hypothetical protein P8N52_03505 [Crocinitomicaceae bacterium]|nr:hypothetical protein [Crocinitomicaceae bacterium]MDG1777201.1 hypothetical protein [Crocinitomicaceae bacterium]
MEQTPEERKHFLAELNTIALYTGTILHGEELTKVRIRQLKKYFNKTFNLLNRLAVIKGDIVNNSFKYCYGGKLLGRKVLIDLEIVKRIKTTDKKARYKLLIHPSDINLELVSRIIVEVYLIRNDVDPL